MQLLFLFFLVGYPALQILTFMRSKGGGRWRVASIACLIPALPFYLWTLWTVLTPQPSGDLSGILILLLAPVTLIYLVALAWMQSADDKHQG